MSDGLIEIEYVGNKPKKRDTVAGTRTTWRGKGDVQLVERGVAQRLLDFPEVWVRHKPGEGLANVAPDAGKGGKQAPDDEPTALTLQQRLVQVIDGLGKDGFTDHGRPRKSAVVQALGEDVSVGDIADAWEEWRAQRTPEKGPSGDEGGEGEDGDEDPDAGEGEEA